MEPDAPVTAGMLHEFVRHIDDRLEALRTEMREGFARVDTRFDHVERRFDQVETRFAQIERRFDHVETRFAHLDQRLGRMDDRFLLYDRRFLTTTLLSFFTAGVALAVSLFALLR